MMLKDFRFVVVIRRFRLPDGIWEEDCAAQ
jgi:hypothetical protein